MQIKGGLLPSLLLMIIACDVVPMFVEVVYDGFTSVFASQHPYVIPCDVTTVALNNQAAIKPQIVAGSSVYVYTSNTCTSVVKFD